MEVRLAKDGEMKAILAVYEAARQYMRRSGNPTQWGMCYPPEALLREDIRAGRLFVCTQCDSIHGVFAFLPGNDPTYGYIEGAWKNDLPYGTIHRVASDGTLGGVFRCCFDFCRRKMDNIRIDTHHDNLTMQRAVETCGFERCGTMYVKDGSPRIAYQYTAAAACPAKDIIHQTSQSKKTYKEGYNRVN